MAYTHARREEIARAKGFASYREYRAAAPAARAQATAKLAASDPSYKGKASQAGRYKIDTPAGTMLRTNPTPKGPEAPQSGWSQVLRGLEARRDMELESVTLGVWDGGQLRSVDVFGHGGSAGTLADGAGNHGGGGAGLRAYLQRVLDELEPDSDVDGDTDAVIGGDVVGVSIVLV